MPTADRRYRKYRPGQPLSRAVSASEENRLRMSVEGLERGTSAVPGLMLNRRGGVPTLEGERPPWIPVPIPGQSIVIDVFTGDTFLIEGGGTLVLNLPTLFGYLSFFTAFDDTLSLSSTDNYAGVTATWAFQPWVRLAGNGATDCGLTGIVAPPGTNEGAEVYLLYTGPGTLHLTHQDAASTAANRVITPTGKDWLLRVGQCVQLRYDRAASRWRVLSGESDMTGATSTADGAPGLVPKPLIADRTLYLDGSGDWSAPAAAPAAFSGAEVTRSTAFGLTNTDTLIPWTAENLDTDAYHDNVTNNVRLTVPSDGYYQVGLQVYQVENFGATKPDTITFHLRKGGADLCFYRRETNATLTPAGTLPALTLVSPPVHATAGQFFQAMGKLDPAGATADLNFNSSFWITKLGG